MFLFSIFLIFPEFEEPGVLICNKHSFEKNRENGVKQHCKNWKKYVLKKKEYVVSQLESSL